MTTRMTAVFTDDRLAALVTQAAHGNVSGYLVRAARNQLLADDLDRLAAHETPDDEAEAMEADLLAELDRQESHRPRQGAA